MCCCVVIYRYRDLLGSSTPTWFGYPMPDVDDFGEMMSDLGAALHDGLVGDYAAASGELRAAFNTARHIKSYKYPTGY